MDCVEDGYDSFNDDDLGEDEVDYDDDGDQFSDDDEVDQVRPGASAAGRSAGGYRGEENFDDGTFDDDSKEFVCLDLSDIMSEQTQLAERVASTMDVTTSEASLLLRAFGWDREKLMSQFFEIGGDELKLKAGLTTSTTPQTPSDPVECGVCWADFPIKDTSSISCGHHFCNPCWNDYLCDRLSTSSQDSVRSVCLSYKCPVRIPDEHAKKLLSESEWKKYQTFLLRSYVENNRNMAWCPAPGCEFVVKSNGGVLKNVTCTCGFMFCFRCHLESHAPVSCANLELWLDKCQNESETAHWIIANTKKCPKCLVRIEKNHGCNHMKCTTCKHEFCWICMGDWTEHGNHTGGFYKCNVFRGAKAKDKCAPEEMAKAELDRYLHYYQRYHNHDQSRKFAKRQNEQVSKRMRDLRKEESGASWVDVEFLQKASEQVMQCRQVLSYTYAYGYFLEDGPEKTLFEDLQQQLERSTETLHEESEKQFKLLDKHLVINLTSVTKTFAKNLLEGVEKGLTH